MTHRISNPVATDLNPAGRRQGPNAARVLALLLAAATHAGAATAQIAEPATSSPNDSPNGAEPAIASNASANKAANSRETATDGNRDERFSDLLERSLEGAGSFWQRSTQSADAWWQRSREATLEAWDGAQRSLSPTEPAPAAAIWKELVPKLEQTLQIEDDRPQLPDRAWLGRDKRDAEADINALLDASVGILSRSPVQDYRAQIEAVRTQIADARTKIDQFRRARIAAPSESLMATTVADYDARIAEREAEIRRYQAELEQIKAEFVGELRAMGLELSNDQIDLLLATVVGDNLIDLGIVFDNVKAITQQLETLVEDSGEDLESARRYYGMYVILLRALARMHSDVEQAIETRYMPEIDAIAERAARLNEETRALMQSQPDRRELLRNNLEAQQLTIEAAGVYRDYLIEQRHQVAQARTALDADIQTAWNTYQTVRVSGELVDLVQSSQRLLDGLLEREVPPLRPFQNLQMQRELEKLTRELRRSGD
ncbi:MAG: hypothetical protein VBE63_01530 [Lamprobacter sp.]|uniref:hypothetical protein n=1 Tax=Lamprobacter sp. TaxID=3100796 RepID=UPI002B2639AF|nr:hypothetical protein [Lamprobacter sp.]MEA3638607.1 hypothetical protein [Lamprobacter sp.]